jgi:tRNA(adenine34) deaminase
MGLALAQARGALAHDDVPVGAVVLIDGLVVAARHNERELTGDPTAHAEVLALRDAALALGGWRLSAATLVVTLEPCPMCAGALVAARVGRLVYGAADPRAGACGTLYNLCCDPRLNHELPITTGVREAECATNSTPNLPRLSFVLRLRIVPADRLWNGDQLRRTGGTPVGCTSNLAILRRGSRQRHDPRSGGD